MVTIPSRELPEIGKDGRKAVASARLLEKVLNGKIELIDERHLSNLNLNEVEKQIIEFVIERNTKAIAPGYKDITDKTGISTSYLRRIYEPLIRQDVGLSDAPPNKKCLLMNTSPQYAYFLAYWQRYRPILDMGPRNVISDFNYSGGSLSSHKSHFNKIQGSVYEERASNDRVYFLALCYTNRWRDTPVAVYDPCFTKRRGQFEPLDNPSYIEELIFSRGPMGFVPRKLPV